MKSFDFKSLLYFPRNREIMKKFSKTSVFLIAVMTVFFSCSKDEITTRTEKVPDGWKLERQTVVIDHQGYYVDLVYNEETMENKYINEPKEVVDFFNQYDETFVPHIVQDDNGKVMFFYKDWNDLLENVKMKPSNEDRTKAFNGGYSKSFKMYNGANYNILGSYFRHTMLTYKTFEFNSVTAWGESTSNVGNSFNDVIKEVGTGRTIGNEPIHYMGCEHANWGGRRFVYTNTTNFEFTLELWTVPFTRGGLQKWHDKISSCETWQAYYDSPHWNNPTI